MPSLIKLSKTSKIDLRDCWKHEATDFTPCLASGVNIALLAEVTHGVKLDWRRLEGKKASSIDCSQSFKVTSPENQEEIFAWYKEEYTEKFISFFKPMIKKL